MIYSKSASVVLLVTALLFGNSDCLEAVSRKPKIKVVEPVQPKSESYYDNIWRKWQVGSKKDQAEVLKDLRATVKKNNDEFMAHYYLGIMLTEEGNLIQATNHLENSLAGFPKSADIYARIAENYEKRNKPAIAITNYEKALELDSNNATALSKLGLNALSNGESALAEAYLSKAKTIEPEKVETIVGLAAAFNENSKPSEAVPLLDQALLFDGTNAEAYWQLAKAYEKLAQADKAAANYTK